MSHDAHLTSPETRRLSYDKKFRMGVFMTHSVVVIVMLSQKESTNFWCLNSLSAF